MKQSIFIILFIIFYICLIMFMVAGNASTRKKISEIVSTISGSFILVSIFMLIFNEYQKLQDAKKGRVLELNAVNNNLMELFYGMFFENKEDLQDLHNEIFKGVETGDSLSYKEYIALQIIFTIFLNIYRQYIITGGEEGMLKGDLYESIDLIIRKTLKSKKALFFWKENKNQFKSLGFIEWLENKYI